MIGVMEPGRDRHNGATRGSEANAVTKNLTAALPGSACGLEQSLGLDFLQHH
jgi:hypothetical protein